MVIITRDFDKNRTNSWNYDSLSIQRYFSTQYVTLIIHLLVGNIGIFPVNSKRSNKVYTINNKKTPCQCHNLCQNYHSPNSLGSFKRK